MSLKVRLFFLVVIANIISGFYARPALAESLNEFPSVVIDLRYMQDMNDEDAAPGRSYDKLYHRAFYSFATAYLVAQDLKQRYKVPNDIVLIVPGSLHNNRDQQVLWRQEIEEFMARPVRLGRSVDGVVLYTQDILPKKMAADLYVSLETLGNKYLLQHRVSGGEPGTADHYYQSMLRRQLIDSETIAVHQTLVTERTGQGAFSAFLGWVQLLQPVFEIESVAVQGITSSFDARPVQAVTDHIVSVARALKPLLRAYNRQEVFRADPHSTDFLYGPLEVHSEELDEALHATSDLILKGEILADWLAYGLLKRYHESVDATADVEVRMTSYIQSIRGAHHENERLHFLEKLMRALDHSPVQLQAGRELLPLLQEFARDPNVDMRRNVLYLLSQLLPRVPEAQDQVTSFLFDRFEKEKSLRNFAVKILKQHLAEANDCAGALKAKGPRR